jgi:conjugative relaxase-like TrwC/TraI family protein
MLRRRPAGLIRGNGSESSACFSVHGGVYLLCFPVMLSLWKLRVGAEAYYLAQVASGLEDYYSGHGEAAGRWIGAATPALGLTGEVDGEDLRAVLAGLTPGSGLTPNGEQLRSHRRRVPGFDLTFSVPKSVSVVYALGDPLVQAAVVDAGQTAVAEALGWLEREACHVRRGTNNRAAVGVPVSQWGTRRLPGVGFVGAAFRHRTSRAGDPQLHWHVLVANLTRGPDGRWSALDATGLYRSTRTAGAVFQTVLRRELTQRLGVEWLAVHDDVAEVAGVPRRVCRWFSKRRDDIEAELARLGQSGPAAAQAATLATRQPKVAVDAEVLQVEWRQAAAGLGWGPADLDALLAQTPTRTTGPDAVVALPVDRIGFVAQVAGRLTDTDGVFTRHDVTQTVAGLLAEGADATTVDRHVSLVLASNEIVPLLPEPTAKGVEGGWEQCFTTTALLAVERRLLTHLQPAAEGCGVLDPSLLDRVIAAQPGLGGDQVDAVRRLAGQGGPVGVLVGRAGTGKTTTLAALADAYRVAGWTVVGVAPSARAARELETGAKIDASTVPRFHHRCRRQPLHERSLVVVDEVGMCDTVDLTAILDAARTAGAKVVMVGDPRQLPEIGPGGGLAAAIARLGDAVVELTVNRRQQQVWEIEALDQLRHGDPLTAWHAYRDHGRVVLDDDPIALHRRAVNDWWASTKAGRHAVLLAGTRAEAAALNRLARHHATQAGRLVGMPLRVEGRDFQIGDRVLCLRNAEVTNPDGQPTTVDNGTLGVVTAVQPATGSLDVTVVGSGRPIRLDRGYLAAGWLDHGYAMTIHKAQGATCDEVFVVGPAGLTREAGYVALSRARHGARLYATTRQAAELDTHSTGLPLPGDTETDPTDEIVERLHRSTAKTLTLLDHPDLPDIHRLAALRLDELEARRVHARAVEHDARATGIVDPADARRRHEHAEATRRVLAAGRRVHAQDHDNVGTVVALDDRHGTATVRFVAATGATALRTLPWHQLTVIDQPSEVALTGDADAWLKASARHLATIETAWTTELARHGVTPGDVDRVGRAVDLRITRLAHGLRADPPEWLTWWLGPRPVDSAGATVHDDILTRLVAWRDRHHLPAETPGYGDRPADPADARSWRDELTALLDTRAWLARRAPEPGPVELPKLSAAQIHTRLDELHLLLATAPADQTRLIDRLVAGDLEPAELHASLVEGGRTQTARADWILTNWPHVVEHEQLTRLAQHLGPLDHWPAPVPATVTDVLDRLALTVPAPAVREDRTLAELHDLLQRLDPGAHLQALTTRLVALNRRVDDLAATIAATTDAHRRALLDHEHQLLTAERADLRAALVAEREQLATAQLYRNDPASQLHDAIAHRHTTIVHDTLTARPDWLTHWLTALDTHGTLTQLPDHHTANAITDLATYRDRWNITTIDPLGPMPEPGSIQLDEWQHVAPNARSIAEPRPSTIHR